MGHGQHIISDLTAYLLRYLVKFWGSCCLFVFESQLHLVTETQELGVVEYSGSQCLQDRRSQDSAELCKLGKPWLTLSGLALLAVQSQAPEGILGSLFTVTALSFYSTTCWIRATSAHTWQQTRFFDLNATRANRKNFLGLGGFGSRGSTSDPEFAKGELERKHLCQALSDGQVWYYPKYTKVTSTLWESILRHINKCKSK